MIDVEALLTEIAPDLPCGPDLAYEAGFQELELAARGKPEQQFGETLIRAEEPDWNEVRSRAIALFARTKDWVAACCFDARKILGCGASSTR